MDRTDFFAKELQRVKAMYDVDTLTAEDTNTTKQSRNNRQNVPPKHGEITLFPNIFESTVGPQAVSVGPTNEEKQNLEAMLCPTKSEDVEPSPHEKDENNF